MSLPVALFGIAALGGAVMAVLRLRGAERPPMAVALIHGALAAAGLVVLIMSVLSAAPAPMTRVALVLFVAAALGGFVLFSFHLRQKALPIGLVLIHGAVAVVAFVLLILGSGV